MEVELFALLFAFQFQLAQQTLLIHADTHGTQFERAVQYRIPYQDITVQTSLAVFSYRAPVIIVRGATVMLFTIAQFASDADYEHSAVFLADSILTLFRRLIRIHLQQVLTVDESNLLRQERFNLWISLTGKIFCSADGSVDTFHHILQVSDSAVILGDYSFPVPLVHVKRVQVVQFLVSTYSVHIRIDTVTRLDFVFSQRESLPFSQRMYYLSLGIA